VLINVACPLIDPPLGDVMTDVTPFMRVTPSISLSTLRPTSARMCGLNCPISLRMLIVCTPPIS
jgi:hypothetical protein